MSGCNGCRLTELKRQYRNRLIKIGDRWYLKGQSPLPGQSVPTALHDGTPIRFLVSFLSEDHSYDGDCNQRGER